MEQKTKREACGELAKEAIDRIVARYESPSAAGVYADGTPIADDRKLIELMLRELRGRAE